MDEIQKILIKKGRLDLAKLYYEKISKLKKEDWVSDSKEKSKRLDKIMQEQGLSDISKNAEDIANALPWFIDTNPELNDFWDMNHAFWSIDTRIGRKGKDIYLVDWMGNILKLELKVKKT